MKVFNSFTVEPVPATAPGPARLRVTLDLGPWTNSSDTRIRIETLLERGDLPLPQLLEQACSNGIALLQRLKAQPVE